MLSSQYQTRNLGSSRIPEIYNLHIPPAELFKASWKTNRRKEVKQIQNNRASSRFGTFSARSTVGRPKTTDVVARRLIGQALSVNLVGKEEDTFTNRRK
jgi:hypothetical protein